MPNNNTCLYSYTYAYTLYTNKTPTYPTTQPIQNVFNVLYKLSSHIRFDSHAFNVYMCMRLYTTHSHAINIVIVISAVPGGFINIKYERKTHPSFQFHGGASYLTVFSLYCETRCTPRFSRI